MDPPTLPNLSEACDLLVGVRTDAGRMLCLGKDSGKVQEQKGRFQGFFNSKPLLTIRRARPKFWSRGRSCVSRRLQGNHFTVTSMA